jgi:hypothetical protein
MYVELMMVICHLCHEAAPFDPYVKISIDLKKSELKGKKKKQYKKSFLLRNHAEG